MRSQTHLRDELRFVTEFNTLFDVLQQVAVSHLRRLDELLGGAPSLIQGLTEEFFPLLPSSAGEHPLVRGGAAGRLMVVITSDEGLVGPLHSAVIREAHRRAEGAAEWLLIGQRGLRLLGRQASAVRIVPIPPEERVVEQMQRVTQFLLTQYTQRALKDAWLVAPRFLSVTRQDVVSYQLLPLPAPTPKRLVWGPAPPATDLVEGVDVVVEPSTARLVEQLAETWLQSVCVEAFWSARRAEFAARALHIEASRQELARRSRTIRHEFFKTLHERVDVLVRETCVVQRHAADRTALRGQSP